MTGKQREKVKEIILNIIASLITGIVIAGFLIYGMISNYNDLPTEAAVIQQPETGRYFNDNDEYQQYLKEKNEYEIQEQAEYISYKTTIQIAQDDETEPVFIPLDVSVDKEIQEKIAGICEEQHISFPLVMAIIKHESKFDSSIIGDGGESFGLMQIQPKWHNERMEKLEVTDLLDPINNTRVGVDYLMELSDKYCNIDMVLMAYNMGESTAKKLWNKGTYQSNYSKEIMETAAAYEQYIELK